jgi:phage gp29-like protein
MQKLTDAHGRPVETAKLTQMLAEPGIVGVRQVWSPSIASGLTPLRLAAILRACDTGDLDSFLVLAEEMEERDMHYFSVLGTRKRVISGVMPKVVAAGEKRVDKAIAAAVQAEIAEHDGFSELVESLLDALGKSFAVVEIDWRTTAQRWGIRQFIHRDPRFFVFDKYRREDIRLKTDAASWDGEALPPYKFLTHRIALKSGLTFRGGLARMVSFGWMCKQFTLKDWMAFMETYGLPMRLGRYGPEATAEDVRKLFQAVASIGSDAAAILPKSMDIDFQEPNRVSGDNVFMNLARYIDEQVSKGVLGQTMTSDNGSSQSQATVHDGVRHDIAAADARAVSATINRDLVRAFVDLNFGVQETYPRILIEVPEPEDTKLLIDSAVALMGAGVKFKATELRGKLGFSDPEEGDEIVGGTPAAAPPPAPAPNRLARNRLALNRQEGEDLLDETLDDMLSDWEEVGEGMEAAIAAAIDGADSYEGVLDRLPETLRQMPTALLIDTLVKGMFKARAVGDAQDD